MESAKFEMVMAVIRRSKDVGTETAIFSAQEMADELQSVIERTQHEGQKEAETAFLKGIWVGLAGPAAFIVFWAGWMMAAQ